MNPSQPAGYSYDFKATGYPFRLYSGTNALDRIPDEVARQRAQRAFIVCGRTVLTAAHVVAGAVSVEVRDPGKRKYKASLDPEFVGDSHGRFLYDALMPRLAGKGKPSWVSFGRFFPISSYQMLFLYLQGFSCC